MGGKRFKTTTISLKMLDINFKSCMEITFKMSMPTKGFFFFLFEFYKFEMRRICRLSIPHNLVKFPEKSDNTQAQQSVMIHKRFEKLNKSLHILFVYLNSFAAL